MPLFSFIRVTAYECDRFDSCQGAGQFGVPSAFCPVVPLDIEQPEHETFS